MKRLLYALLLLLALMPQAWGADSKVTALDALASPTSDDLVYCVDDPAGTPVSKKCTLTAIFGTGDGLAHTWTSTHDLTGAVLLGASPLVFEGATANAFETTFAVTDPTADRTITFPDLSGIVALNGEIGLGELDDGDCSDGEAFLKVAGAWACGNPSASEADTLDTVFDRGKTIDGANSLANAVRIGDGTTPMCYYTDATLGPVVRPCTDANVRTLIPTNFTWALYDIEGAAAIETVDPDGASANAIWQYGAAYRPRKSIGFGAGSLSVDGTECATPSERTPVASGPKLWTIRCTDSSSGVIHGSTQMPDSWDGGTITFTIMVTHGTTENIGTDGDVSASCRADSGAISSTYGTAIALDVDVTTAGDVEMATSAAVTPNGSCAGGDFLYWKWVKDAGGSDANSANTDILNFKMEYTVSSRSD